MRRPRKKLPRWLRFALDALLALFLLLTVYVALNRPFRGVTAAFRSAERAALTGPSEIIDRLPVPESWLILGCSDVLIGEYGEEILFWFYRQSTYSGTLLRYEKRDGLLLLPLPNCNYSFGSELKRDMVMPLFLFADDPAAVKATVRISLSETDELTLTQVRGEKASSAEGDADSRERYFLFSIPVTRENWTRSRGADVRELLLAYAHVPYRPTGRPVALWLYDEEDRLIGTGEWTL